jgi:hypothetical protein
MDSKELPMPPPPSYPPPPLPPRKSPSQKDMNSVLERNNAINNLRNQKYANLFMILMLFLGIINFIVAWIADQNLQNNAENDKNCKSSLMKTCIKIVSILSNIMITIPIFYKYGNCDNPESVHYKKYVYIMLFLGILFIVLGAIISYESIKVECRTSAHPEIIWILGIIITIGSLAIILSSR